MTEKGKHARRRVEKRIKKTPAAATGANPAAVSSLRYHTLNSLFCIPFSPSGWIIWPLVPAAPGRWGGAHPCCSEGQAGRRLARTRAVRRGPRTASRPAGRGSAAPSTPDRGWSTSTTQGMHAYNTLLGCNIFLRLYVASTVDRYTPVEVQHCLCTRPLVPTTTIDPQECPEKKPHSLTTSIGATLLWQQLSFRTTKRSRPGSQHLPRSIQPQPAAATGRGKSAWTEKPKRTRTK